MSSFSCGVVTGTTSIWQRGGKWWFTGLIDNVVFQWSEQAANVNLHVTGNHLTLLNGEFIPIAYHVRYNVFIQTLHLRNYSASGFTLFSPQVSCYAHAFLCITYIMKKERENLRISHGLNWTKINRQNKTKQNNNKNAAKAK